MPHIDARTGEVVIRIVYDGPPEAGKTTNVRQLGQLISLQRRGDAVTPGAPDDGEGRTEYFDWLDFAGGYLDGRRVRCQLVSVPGQSTLSHRREFLLAGADVIVFVVDSRRDLVAGASDRLSSMLVAVGEARAAEIGVIVQANKQDHAEALAPDDLVRALGLESVTAVVPSVASRGEGVMETFVVAARFATERARGKTLESLAELPASDRTPDALHHAMKSLDEARRRKEEAAREEAERVAREEAERKARQAEKKRAREEAERKARQADEERAREEAERKARQADEERAREEAEQRAREADEKRAREEAERKTREADEKRAREEAERKARQADEKRAREEAEQRAREADEKRAREEAERKTREADEKRAREEAARKARELERKLAREEAARKARELEARVARDEAARKLREQERALREESARKLAERESAAGKKAHALRTLAMVGPGAYSLTPTSQVDRAPSPTATSDPVATNGEPTADAELSDADLHWSVPPAAEPLDPEESKTTVRPPPPGPPAAVDPGASAAPLPAKTSAPVTGPALAAAPPPPVAAQAARGVEPAATSLDASPPAPPAVASSPTPTTIEPRADSSAMPRSGELVPSASDLWGWVKRLLAWLFGSDRR